MWSTRVLRASACILVALVGLTVACAHRYPLGRLAARVLDADGLPVSGVAADLYKVTPSGRIYWRAARTSANGLAVFGAKSGVIEGEYIVHVTLMPWHMFTPGEQNDRAVQIKAGDDVVISFRVVPRLPSRSLLPPDSSQLPSVRERSSHA
jgi:hypothetical protein